MFWMADECVDPRIVAALRADAHDVVHILESARGVKDVDVLDRLKYERRLLLTEDKDFGDLVIRRAYTIHGLVLLRVQPEILTLKCSQLRALIAQFGERLFGRYTVVEASRFRSRPLL